MDKEPANPKQPVGDSKAAFAQATGQDAVPNVDEQARDLQKVLFEKIKQSDRAGVGALVEQWGKAHGFENFFTEIMEPVLIKVGESWATAGALSLAQGYIAGKIAEDVLLKTMEAGTKKPAVAAKGPVVIGNIEEDFHALGRRMVGIFLRAEGWIVYDLGNDVTPKEFVDKAIEVGARVIGVSALMLTTAYNIKRLRQEIDRRGLTGKIQIAVGGAAFVVCPGLVEEVGGDGTAANALIAGKIFYELWEKSVQMEESE